MGREWLYMNDWFVSRLFSYRFHLSSPVLVFAWNRALNVGRIIFTSRTIAKVILIEKLLPG